MTKTETLDDVVERLFPKTLSATEARDKFALAYNVFINSSIDEGITREEAEEWFDEMNFSASEELLLSRDFDGYQDVWRPELGAWVLLEEHLSDIGEEDYE